MARPSTINGYWGTVGELIPIFTAQSQRKMSKPDAEVDSVKPIIQYRESGNFLSSTVELRHLRIF